MWESEEDDEFTLGFDFDLSKYNVASNKFDVEVDKSKIDSENRNEQLNSYHDTKEKCRNFDENTTEKSIYKPKILLRLHLFKVWALMNRDTIGILVFLTICLIIGISIPLSLVYKTQKLIRTPSRYHHISSKPGKDVQVNNCFNVLGLYNSAHVMF